MKLVLEITSHAGDGSITHRSIEAFPATLGRGYHNDIIIGDPHISAQHVRIEYDGKDFVIHDLESENGIMLNDRHHKSGSAMLKSGDTVRIGRTAIRIFDPQHPVPPAQRLQRAHPVLQWLARPLTVWTSFLLAVAMAAGWKYLETWRADEVAEAVGGAGFGAIVIVLVWSALWAVAGRLVRHKSRFRSHVSLASLFILSMIIASSVQAYAGFLTNESAAATFTIYALNMALCIALLYGALTLATDMAARKKRVWCGFFTAGLLLAAVGFSQATKDRFDASPTYAATLKPYLAFFASAESPEGFMLASNAVFASDVFGAPDKE